MAASDDTARVAIQAQHPTAAGMVGDAAATAAAANQYEDRPERASFWTKVMRAINGSV